MVLPGKGMSWKDFFKDLRDEWQRDQVGNVAGALTFFLVLALFPFLLFLVALAGVVINPATAEELVRQLGKVAPQEVTTIVGERLHSLAMGNNVGLLTVSGVAAVWAASGGVVALMRALNTAYGVEESRPFWKVRGIALLVTLGGAVLSIIASVIMVATPALAGRLGEPLTSLVLWLRLPVAALLVMLVWAFVYYILPDVEQRFRFISPGSVVGVLIWLAASWGFSQYVAHFGRYEVTYGALGGVIVLLLWMWITAQAVLLGAEINSIIEHRSPEGKVPGAKRMEERGAAASKSRSAPERSPEAVVQRVAGPAREPVQPRRSPVGAAAWLAGLGLGAWVLRRTLR